MAGPVIAPTNIGASQLASKFVLQVDTASSVNSPTWLTVFGVFSFTPNIDYTMQDNSDFDSDGWGADFPTQRKWNTAVSLRDKLYGGTQDAGQAFLQTQTDALEQIHIRYFDREGGDAAYEGWAYGQWAPQGGSVTDESTITVTLTGQGERTKIANPVATSSAPVINGADPSGAAATEMVTITGSFFTGATTVKFGGTAATAFVIVSDAKIVASMPTGSAGAAGITITTPVGTASSFTYTRGA